MSNKLNEEIEALYDDFGICEREDCPGCRDIKEGIKKVIKQAEIRVAREIINSDEEDLFGLSMDARMAAKCSKMINTASSIINKTKGTK